MIDRRAMTGDLKSQRSPVVRGCAVFAALVAAFVGLVWIALEISAYRTEMARIPEKLSVEHKIYAEEKSWGYGLPGDAETGLAVYRLNGQDAERLMVASASMTDSDSIRNAVGRRPTKRDYYDWYQTPFDPVKAGSPWDRLAVEGEPVRIGPMLFRGGAFGIEIDDDIEQQVDQVLNSPGSYYATGSGSVVIVIAPREELVIFAYAG